jgi:hypothetical protein
MQRLDLRSIVGLAGNSSPEFGVRIQALVMRRAIDGLANAGARVDEARPPVSFAEQVELFNQLVGAAVSPSRPDDRQISPGVTSRMVARRRPPS